MEESPKKITRTIGRYLTEIIVIFIGITISFLFDQWREHRNNIKKEIDFVNSLVTDLKNKVTELEGSDYKGATLLVQNTDSLFQCFYNHKPVSDQLAVFWIREYANRWTFNTTTPTYRSSAATGEWQELPDSLRREIYDVYEMKFHALESRYHTANEIKAHFMNTYFIQQGTIRFLDFKSLQGKDVKPPEYEKIKKVLLAKEFLDNVSMICVYARANRELHQSIISKIQTLIADLELYLKKLD